MAKRPVWYIILAVVALLWNVSGAWAVISDIGLSASEIAALPAQQQALYATRPLWTVWASVVAVVAGTLGSICLLIRKRWAAGLFYASIAGLVLQDFGLLLVAGATEQIVFQGVVLTIAIGLLFLARKANASAWTA